MSGGKGGDAPTPPDYLALANRQGQINADSARLGTQLSRVNQYTPYGSVTYSQSPSQVTGQASTSTPSDTSSSSQSGYSGSPNFSGMYGYLGQTTGLSDALRGYDPSQSANSGPTFAPGNDQWSQTVSLSPEQQQLFDINQSNQINLGQTAASRLGQISSQGPLSLSGLPSQISSVNPSSFQSNVSAPGTAYSNVDLSNLQNFGKSPVQSSLDFSNLNPIPQTSDLAAGGKQVQDALYGQATSYLDPQFNQTEEQLKSSLINSGNTEGSEGWNNAMGNFDRQKQAAYADARNSAIAAGGSEQSRELQAALAARGQQVGEITGAGQFANQAAGQANSQAAAQRAQQLSEILSQAQFGNSAAQQELQSELAKAGLYNTTQDTSFSQGQTNAALQNASRAQGLQELLTEQNLPLQQFMSLYGGAQPNVPNASVGGSQQVTPYDLMGAANQQYQTQLNAYNAQQAQQSGLLGGLLGLGGSLGSAAILSSDERLKDNIEPIGELPQGVGVYEYEYKADPTNTRHVGVMAQELEKVQPEAVFKDKRGYRAVDYKQVLARALRDAA